MLVSCNDKRGGQLGLFSPGAEEENEKKSLIIYISLPG